MRTPERFEHVGAAGAARDRAIAVLGHRDAARRGHDRDRGRDVERAGVVAAGAAGVEQRRALACGSAARARASPAPCRRSRRGSRPSCAARRPAPAICAGVASPARICSMAARASSRGERLAQRRRGRWRSGSPRHLLCWRHSVRKFSISLSPGLVSIGLGMELHAPGLVLAMLERHDLALGRPGRQLEHLGQAARARRSASDSASPRTGCRARRRGRGPLCRIGTGLAVHQARGAHHRPPNTSPMRLVPEAHAQDRHAARRARGSRPRRCRRRAARPGPAR